MKLDCPLCDTGSLISYMSLDRWSIKHGWTLERIIGSTCDCAGLANLSRAYVRQSDMGMQDVVYFYDGESSPDEIEAALSGATEVQYSLDFDIC